MPGKIDGSSVATSERHLRQEKKKKKFNHRPSHDQTPETKDRKPKQKRESEQTPSCTWFLDQCLMGVGELPSNSIRYLALAICLF